MLGKKDAVSAGGERRRHSGRQREISVYKNWRAWGPRMDTSAWVGSPGIMIYDNYLEYRWLQRLE
jgi:hypothetical protein